MFDIIGWLVLIVPLGWLSIFVFFITVPTFSDALFSKRWYHKLLGIVMWVALISAWVWWLSFITVTV